jgi:hypothetical protein
MEYGILHLFLYAPCLDGAIERGMAVTRQLPYEILSDVVHGRPAERETHPRFQQHIAQARMTGIASFVVAVPTGTGPIEGFEEWRNS